MRQAAELANALGAELLLLHVRHGSEPRSGALFAPPPHGAVDERAGDDLAAWTADAQRLAPGRATSVELSGRPAAEIVRFAREFSCDAIVVGTHGRSGVGRLALGSVAEEVLRTTPCPVVVVRSAAAT